MTSEIKVFRDLPPGFRKTGQKFSLAKHGPRDDVCRSHGDDYICSRAKGHRGRHEAAIVFGPPAVIVAVWDAI